MLLLFFVLNSFCGVWVCLFNYVNSFMKSSVGVDPGHFCRGSKLIKHRPKFSNGWMTFLAMEVFSTKNSTGMGGVVPDPLHLIRPCTVQIPQVQENKIF